MLKIYLDNCCYNRPFDDLAIGNNGLEAAAKVFIQSLIKYKCVELCYSFILQSEIEDSPYEDTRLYILDFVEANACTFIGKNRFDEIKALINEIMLTGIKAKDAAHLACALLADCDYFITTDKRLLKYTTNKMNLINPIKFVEMWREL